MASGEDKRGAPAAPANDSIDELLGGLPSDPMLPRRRARSIEEVKAAEGPASQGRRSDDKVVVSEGTDPRERARMEADRERRESSTFGTAFLQAHVTREKIVVGFVMMLAVLGIYAFARHQMHPSVPTEVTPAMAQSVQNTHNPQAPITAADIPPPPTAATATATSTEAATEVAPHPTAKASHPSETHANKPPPPAGSASQGRTDVSRSL